MNTLTELGSSCGQVTVDSFTKHLSNATCSTDRDTEWQEISGGIDCSADSDFVKSKTLILAITTMEETVIVLVLAGCPFSTVSTNSACDVTSCYSVIGSIIVSSILNCLMSILSWHSKTTTDSIECSILMHVFTSTSRFSVEVVMNIITLIVTANNCLLVSNCNRWMIHHLFATSCDSNHLSKVSSFFNEAVELFSNTFDNVATFTKEATMISH